MVDGFTQIRSRFNFEIWSTRTFIPFSLKIKSRGFVRKWRVIVEQAIVFSLALNNNRPVIVPKLKWFNSYLHERYQYMSSGCEESSKRLIIHGVLQGSILGPTLFNIYVNESLSEH